MFVFVSSNEGNHVKSVAALQVESLWIKSGRRMDTFVFRIKISFRPEGYSMAFNQTRDVLDTDACLVSFYSEMAQRALSEKVREVFQNLLKMEESEQLRLSKEILEF